MKDSKQIEALAGLDGWGIVKTIGKNSFSAVPPNEKPLRNKWLSIECAMSDYPRYLTSLDALAPIIQGMSRNECREYVDQLIIMLGDFELIHKATPQQVAEAIIKAMGLWEEGL
jgi:hypothetical protein